MRRRLARDGCESVPSGVSNKAEWVEGGCNGQRERDDRARGLRTTQWDLLLCRHPNQLCRHYRKSLEDEDEDEDDEESN